MAWLLALTLLSSSGWRLFDDSTVTTVDESQVVTRYAYVLFYRRRNSPVERPLPGHPPDHRAERTPSAEAAASQVRARVPSNAVGAHKALNRAHGQGLACLCQHPWSLARRCCGACPSWTLKSLCQPGTRACGALFLQLAWDGPCAERLQESWFVSSGWEGTGLGSLRWCLHQRQAVSGVVGAGRAGER